MCAVSNLMLSFYHSEWREGMEFVVRISAESKRTSSYFAAFPRRTTLAGKLFRTTYAGMAEPSQSIVLLAGDKIFPARPAGSPCSLSR